LGRNVKRIFDALTWLKRNNPLYNHIILPDIHDELYLEKLLNTPEFEIQETENDNQSVSDNHKLSLNLERKKK